MVEYTLANIDYTKLKSQADSNIRSILDTRTNIGDPRDPDNDKNRKFIYDSDPFDRAVAFDNMPYLICTLPNVVSGLKSVGGKDGWIEWDHTITIRASRQGASNSLDDRGRLEFLAIIDDLLETFNDRTNIESLKAVRVDFPKLDEINNDSGIVNNVEVYESQFKLTYKTRMTIST